MRELLSRFFGQTGKRRHSPTHEYRVPLGDGRVLVFRFAEDHNAPMLGGGPGMVLINDLASDSD